MEQNTEKSVKSEKEKGILRLAGVLLAFFLFIWFTVAFTSGLSNYRQFVDEPTMGVMLLFTIVALWLGGMGKDFLDGVRLAFSGKEDYSRARLRRACIALRFARMLIFLESVTQICIWLVDFLYHADGDSMVYGPAMAVLLLSMAYASILAVLLTIFIAKLENMQASYRDVPETGAAGDKEKSV